MFRVRVFFVGIDALNCYVGKESPATCVLHKMRLMWLLPSGNSRSGVISKTMKAQGRQLIPEGFGQVKYKVKAALSKTL